MTSCCVAVIGHVDHGKTALVKALTGVDTDRLTEEKARGLSIVPGFAHAVYPQGIIDFIDMPGHTDFVQAMISGTTGARAVLIVISAQEGVRSQTVEHLRIAALLGIKHAVIGISKCDLVEEGVTVDQIRTALRQTPYEQAPVVRCSAMTGEGIATLHGALAKLFGVTETDGNRVPRMLPVDRVFSQSGRGTIVTGTLLGGGIALDSTAVLQPSGLRCDVRGIQSRGEDRSEINASERTAVNLRGITVRDVRRGDVLCFDDTLLASECADVRLRVLPDAPRSLKHMSKVRVHFGAGHEVAQVRLFGAREIAPGKSCLAQLRFAKPILAYAGQAAILRDLSPAQTIGGCTFLDPMAAPTRAGDVGRVAVLSAVETADVSAIFETLVHAGNGLTTLSEIARLACVSMQDVEVAAANTVLALGSDQVSSHQKLQAVQASILQALSAYHVQNPRRATCTRQIVAPKRVAPILSVEAFRVLLAVGDIVEGPAQGTVALASHDPFASLTSVERVQMDALEQQFSAAALDPPPLADVVTTPATQELIDLLLFQGRLVALQNIALKQSLIFHVDTLQSAAKILRNFFPPPLTFTTSQARAAVQTSRRIIVPMLECFDAAGLTTREGNTRSFAGQSMVSPHDLDW